MITIKEHVTIGEKYDPAMSITDPQEAAEYFEALVLHTMSFGHTRKEAEEIERDNLGYYSGYYDHETMVRVQRVFNCAHPIFGKAEEHTPTAEEAFEAGVKMAEGNYENHPNR